MAIVVVGGQTRNIGKTSVAVGLIASLRELQWTAIKWTQADTEASWYCEQREGANAHSMSITEEHSVDSCTDSSRFLTAGASRSFWVRTRRDQMAEAMPWLHQELARARNAIVESNSILEFLQSDVYLSVLDPTAQDFKPSAQYFLDRADAVVWSGGAAETEVARTAWSPGLLRVARSKTQFTVQAPTYTSKSLTEFVKQRIAVCGTKEQGYGKASFCNLPLDGKKQERRQGWGTRLKAIG